jgi:hypothetical protein
VICVKWFCFEVKWSYGEVLVDKGVMYIRVLRAYDYIVTVSFGYILYCVCLNLYCGGFILFCNVCVCVCVGLVMCVFVWVFW